MSLTFDQASTIVPTLTAPERAAFAVENLTSSFVFEMENQSNLGPGDPSPEAEALIFLGAIDEAFGLDSSGLTLNGDEAVVTDDAFFAYRDALIAAVEASGFDLDGFLSGGSFSLRPERISLDQSQAPLDALTGIDAISLVDQFLNFGLAFIPPDTIAAAGTDRLVNVVNTAVEIFEKDGTLLDQFPLIDLFGSLTDTFDPKVVYDQFNDRFVIVTLEQLGVTDILPDPSNDVSNIYVAVSQDGSPSSIDDFDTIVIDALTTGPLTTGETALLWADFPGFSVSDDAVYITNNRFAVDGPGFGTPGLWIIEKGEGEGGFYDGGPANVIFSDPVTEAGLAPALASTIQPSLNFGDLPEGVDNYLYANGFTFGAGVPGAPEAAIVYTVGEPFADGGPTFDFDIVVYPDIDLVTSALPDAPQLDSDFVGIDTNDRRTLDVVFRDGLLYATFTQLPFEGENADQATAFYSVTDPLNGFALEDLVEIGGEDIAPGTFTFFPSIAVNSDGDIAVTFSASGPGVLAGSYLTGRQLGDEPGTLRDTIVIAEGEAPYEILDGAGRNRWGDYTGAVVDPVDDSFWLYNLNAALFPGFIPVWDTAYANVQFGAGNDNLFGDDGDDIIVSGPGRDSLFGRGGNDTLDGGADGDQIRGENGDDELRGDGGRDNLFGGQGDDLAFGGDDADSVFGDAGNDTLNGDGGDDQVFGASGDDVVTGGAGNDRIFGDGGQDVLDGGDGDDSVFAGGGNDTLTGGSGNDELFGGGGSDVFIYTDGDDSFRDFNDNQDTLDISATGISSLEELETFITTSQGRLIFTFDDGDTLELLSTRFSDLNDGNVILAGMEAVTLSNEQFTTSLMGDANVLELAMLAEEIDAFDPGLISEFGLFENPML